MNVLYTSPIMEYPATGGPQLRVLNSVLALNSVSELTVVNRDFNASHETETFFRKESHTYHCLKKRVPLRPEREEKLFRILRKFRRLDSKFEIQQFLYLITKIDAEIIWFGFGNISYRLIKKVKKTYPHKIIICDTDSVWSRYLLRGIPYLNLRGKLIALFRGFRKRFEEAQLIKLSNVITAVSEIDSKYYRDLGQRDKVFPFSNVVNLETYSLEIENEFMLKRHSIFLGGSFGEAGMPMNVATRWFLREVFPLILMKVPEAHLYIVGRRSEKEFGALNASNVTVTGIVESVLPYLMHSNVSIVPLHFESGTRFKILEAGASRVPIVSTTLGAEGINVVDGFHLLIADSPELFSDAVCRLLLDPELSKQLAENCHRLVKSHYCLESLSLEAKSILASVSKR